MIFLWLRDFIENRRLWYYSSSERETTFKSDCNRVYTQLKMEFLSSFRVFFFSSSLIQNVHLNIGTFRLTDLWMCGIGISHSHLCRQFSSFYWKSIRNLYIHENLAKTTALDLIWIISILLDEIFLRHWLRIECRQGRKVDDYHYSNCWQNWHKVQDKFKCFYFRQNQHVPI